MDLDILAWGESSKDFFIVDFGSQANTDAAFCCSERLKLSPVLFRWFNSEPEMVESSPSTKGDLTSNSFWANFSSFEIFRPA